MPNVREGVVTVAGRLFEDEKTFNFDTGKPDGGRQLLVKTSDGFVKIKVPAEVADECPRVGEGQGLAVMVRYGAYANKERGSDAQATTRFVRAVTDDDLDMLRSITSAAASAPSAKAA